MAIVVKQLFYRGLPASAAVTSVNTRTGAVVLDKTDVGLNQVDNTSDVNKPISTATQTALNALDTSLVYDQVVYVDKSNLGVYIANGSINKPFTSIEAMYAAITDATPSKVYCCIIAPGVYSEAATIRIKPHIHLAALSKDTVTINVVGPTTLKWQNSSAGRVYISNIALNTGIEVVNDEPTGAVGLVLELNGCVVSSLLFAGRGGGVDFIQLRNDTLVSGTTIINSGATTIFDSTLIGLLTFTDTGCTVPDGYGSALTGSLRNNYIQNVVITNTTYDVYLDVWGNNPISSLNITSNSAFPSTFNVDAGSYPNSISIAGSPAASVGRTSTGLGIGYTPAVSGDWLTPPTQVSQSLDELAARVSSGATKYTFSFNATTDWSGPTLDEYSITVLKVTHNSNNPIAKVYQLIGTDYIEVDVGVLVNVSEDLKITIKATPDLRFAGKLVIS